MDRGREFILSTWCHFSVNFYLFYKPLLVKSASMVNLFVFFYVCSGSKNRRKSNGRVPPAKKRRIAGGRKSTAGRYVCSIEGCTHQPMQVIDIALGQPL